LRVISRDYIRPKGTEFTQERANGPDADRYLLTKGSRPLDEQPLGHAVSVGRPLSRRQPVAI
jgi:hypothetical protein